MKVSVVIPAYNAEKTIIDAIRSVQAQSLADWECIVADDGSIDGTLDKCFKASKKDPRIKILSLPHCCGAAARNAGIKEARGEYVQFLDADDLLKPEALKEASNFAHSNRLDAVAFNVEVARFTGSILSLVHERILSKRTGNYGICTGCEMLVKMVLANEFSFLPFMQLARRDALRHLFPILVLYEDFPFVVKNFIEFKMVGHLPKMLYIKRCTAGSMLNSKTSIEKVSGLTSAISDIASYANDRKMDIGEEAFNGLQILLKGMQRELNALLLHFNEKERRCIWSLAKGKNAKMDASDKEQNSFLLETRQDGFLSPLKTQAFLDML